MRNEALYGIIGCEDFTFGSVAIMIYLILAMVCSMLITVLMRVSEKYSRGGAGMLAVNYVMCFGLSMAFSGSMQLFPVAAIVLIQGGGKQETASPLGLIVLLLAGGSGDAMSKVYEEVGPAALKDHFLLYTFMAALILCIIVCIVRKQPVGWSEALFGLLIGVPNYFSARFLLLSLGQVPAVIAYPSFSVGTIVMVTLAGMLLFKEKLSRRKLIALGVILMALALLNL